MIRKLRIKFILIVMSIVSVILLAIFFTMMVTAQRNNERMSEGMLRQAIKAGPYPHNGGQPAGDARPLPPGEEGPGRRFPVLVVDVEEDGSVSAVVSQLHFLDEEDIKPLARMALTREDDLGILPDYELRYLREIREGGSRIAFADISMEKEMMKAQIGNSLLIGGASMAAFFLITIFLARWAVRPVEIAWDRQKQFIANASHELKTPLTVILSNAGMLRTGNSFEDEKAVRRLDHIHAEAMRMKQLVEDMLFLARSDHGERSQVYAAVDFSYLVTSAVLVYEPVIYDEEKEFSYEIEDRLSVMGDEARLQQVIHILLDNAGKYSPSGGSIRLTLQKGEHNTLLMKVSNEGEPIPKEELEQIFLRFYRCDDSRSGHGSFGLGLSIAQSIVNDHKGKIWAESDGKSGNHFFVSLPLA
ncbi:MAG: HAMP domain-containing sensor histidine kinase [Lacrimispora sp.]|uniref:sensor histidine kinase n=1 Tax=Lacrimispora sp. TaxID=2719234 RepID=UPI0039E267E6